MTVFQCKQLIIKMRPLVFSYVEHVNDGECGCEGV